MCVKSRISMCFAGYRMPLQKLYVCKTLCLLFAVMATLGFLSLPQARAQEGASPINCEQLNTVAIANTTITLAQSVPAGKLDLPDDAFAPKTPSPALKAALLGRLPAFCRVAATIRPTADSEIEMEVWMPSEGWNGRFLGVGNGAWAGRVLYSELAENLRRGFAVASTDTGHESGPFDASFALGHPEKLIDFGYRAVHLMTVDAKVIVNAFYGAPARFSYWNGCSTGGMQSLMEAQRFPTDYNGILAGAPANYFTHLMFGHNWPQYVTLKDASSHIPEEKFEILQKAVMNACDALDGITDGIISDPTRCHFDPAVLECKGADAADCLTHAQVEAVAKIYQGATNPRTGAQIYPGLEPGASLAKAAGGGSKPDPITLTYFQNVLFKDKNWDWRSLNFDDDVKLADQEDAGILNATDPDLKPFEQHGGKLVMYHGWADPTISPMNSVNYYESVISAMGGLQSTESFARLFMIPGMEHCGKGPGPDDFDKLTVIEQWVEDGKAPDAIVASHKGDSEVDMTRPLCPYPQEAKWTGSGSTNDAANFVCAK